MMLLERLKELEAAATPGPWSLDIAEYSDGLLQSCGPFHDINDESGETSDEKYKKTQADQDLINFSRNALPLLLELAEAAEEWNRAKIVLRESDVDENSQVAMVYYAASEKLSKTLAKLEGGKGNEAVCHNAQPDAPRI